MLLKRLAVALLVVAVVFWWLTRASGIASVSPVQPPDISNGEKVFWAGGCASCHATPVDGRRAKGDDKLLLGGGLELDTPFGVFHVPNISPDEKTGIGAWTNTDFVNAMQSGVSPSGEHYYPSFPYASYARMSIKDILDLKAFLKTLPAVSSATQEHDMQFPWSIRRGIGLWKRLYLSSQWVMDVDTDDPQLVRGRELVEGVGHCGECHTPRTALGGMDTARWLKGASNPDGEGWIPDISPSSESIGDWSVDDLAYYFETGFTPDFDTVGGSMVAVQENLAELTADDRVAIAAYLKALTVPE